MEKTKTKNYKRIWGYFRDHKIMLALSIFASLMVSATDGALAYILKDILDGIFINKDKSFLTFIPLVLMGIMTVRGASRFTQLYVMRALSMKAIEKIRYQLYEKMIRFPMSYFDSTDTGTMMSRIMNDVKEMQTSIPSFVKVLKEFFSVFFLVGVVFYQDFELGMYGILCVPLMAIVIGKTGKKTKKMARRGQEKMGVLANNLQETLSGIRVVKAFVSEDVEINRFKVSNSAEIKYQIRRILILSISSPFLEVLSGIALATIIYVGGLKVLNGAYSAGTFFSFLAAFMMMMEPFKRINNENSSIQGAMAAADRVFELLDTKNDILDNDGDKDCDAHGKLISLENVSFKYATGAEYVLKNLSLEVESGKSVALVGASGAGKSTFVNLIPRFYDLTDGCIKIGGTDIRDFKVYSLRSNIGIVSQEPFLFNYSIYDNIAYGNPLCTKDQVIEAAKAAYAHDFIMELPEGYDTLIGERGDRLSGGQKQRITIARALLKNPSILILDEATSSLDTESEKIVQKALYNLMKGRTSFVIAHRLSTILDADMIVVMNNGNIESYGKHDELLEKSEIYKKLYNMQFKTGDES